MRRRLSLVAAAFSAGAVLLFFVSRGKWSDPLIDSGREWIVPDTLARGEMLYRDVVYWFGPLTPYLQAVFFRVFGSSFAALVAAGAAAGVAVLFLLHALLRRVTGAMEAMLWTGLAIPTLLFMPNAGGIFLGMGYRIWHAAAFAMAGVVMASRSGGARTRRLRVALAGVSAGLAGLCRTEWGVAAAAAVALACLLRSRRRGHGAVNAFGSLAAALVTFAAGIGIFLAEAGSAAVVKDGHVLLTGLPEETRHFLIAFSGLPDWKRGSAELLYSAAAWTGLFLVAALLFVPASGRGRTLVLLAAVLGVLGLAASVGGAGGAVLFSAAPLVSLAGLLAGLSRRRGAPAAALSACGLLGLSLSYRRPFHIGDSGYVGPPLLFAFVCAAGLLHIAVAARHDLVSRERLRAAYRWAVAALVAVALAGRAWQYGSLEGRPIRGTAGMLTARPEVALEIEELSSAVRQQTRPGDGLVVLPEGELLNFLSERRNPIRHKLYLPGYLTSENESAVLAELERARPAAVVIWRRPVSEYDRSLFGEDYGKRIRAWIEANYRLLPFQARDAPRRQNERFLWGIRRERL